MINANLTSGGFGAGGSFWGSIKRVIALFATFVVGALVLMAAGVVAIATAIVGLIIAFVAMFMRFGAYRRPSGRTEFEAEQGEGVVLEARRTARGWKVDG